MYYKAVKCDCCNAIEIVSPAKPINLSRDTTLKTLGWITRMNGRAVLDFCSKKCEEIYNQKQ